MFFSSPANLVSTHLALLERLNCHVAFKTNWENEALSGILSERPMRAILLPPTDSFFADTSTVTYPYAKSFEEAKDDPVAILHSSGTTGTPKLLLGKHGSYSALDAFQRLEFHSQQPLAISHWRSKRVFISTPLYHSSGLPLILAYSAYFDYIPVLVPQAQTITTNIAHSVVRHGNPQCMFTMPNIILDFARDESRLVDLKRLDALSWAGCPLPPKVARQLCATVRSFPLFGSTESMFLPTLLPPPEIPDQALYYQLSPNLGHSFRPIDAHTDNSADQGLHELVINRDNDLALYQAVFFTIPEARKTNEYRTKDLFIQHPDPKWSGWWRSMGRSDDVLVLNSARKINPILIETTICEHPEIAGVVIVGHARDHICLLIEPVQESACKDKVQERAFVERIWPVVQKSLRSDPSTWAVEKDWIIVTPCGQTHGMKRAGGKLTIQRQGTLSKFAKEIEAFYNSRL